MRTTLPIVLWSLKLDLLVDVPSLEAPVQERPKLAHLVDDRRLLRCLFDRILPSPVEKPRDFLLVDLRDLVLGEIRNRVKLQEGYDGGVPVALLAGRL